MVADVCPLALKETHLNLDNKVCSILIGDLTQTKASLLFNFPEAVMFLVVCEITANAT